MKRKNKIILGASLLIIPTVIYATVTHVDELDVRVPSETANTVIHGSSAIGYNNFSSWWSLTAGAHNWAHEDSFAAGHTNDVKNMSGAIGMGNNVNYDAPTQYPRHSFAAGSSNVVLGNSSFASGYNNDVAADQAIALGNGLLATTDNSTIVGKYNDDKAGVSFVVGNGVDDSNRSNALEVHTNGDVIVSGSLILEQAQGDISMGSFGN